MAFQQETFTAVWEVHLTPSFLPAALLAGWGYIVLEGILWLIPVTKQPLTDYYISDEPPVTMPLQEGKQVIRLDLQQQPGWQPISWEPEQTQLPVFVNANLA